MKEQKATGAAKPTFIDLFSGCGGLSLGFLQAGYRCLLAVDQDPKAVDCYNQNLKGSSDNGSIQKDLSELDSPSKVRIFLRQNGVESLSCDVLIGGPPCQSFSVVGRNKIRALMGEDDKTKNYWEEKNEKRNNLFNTYALFLEVLKPRWFLFENVPAIQKHQEFKKIRERFEELAATKTLKYELSYRNYLASKYGVPQNRKRFVIIGRPADIEEENFHQPKEKKTIVTVSEALDDLPKVEHGHKEPKIRYSPASRKAYQRLMRADSHKGSRGFLFHHICRQHNPDDRELFSRMKPGARFADPEVQKALLKINPGHNKLLKYATDKFKDKLHKLHPEKPAWTVTAHLQKDCYKFIHHEQPRTITVREAARLQSFPDWFRFDGIAMVTALKIIGNAVPPLLAQAFAESFRKSDTKLSTPRKRKAHLAVQPSPARKPEQRNQYLAPTGT